MASALVAFAALAAIATAPSASVDRHVAEAPFDTIVLSGVGHIVIIQGPRRDVILSGPRAALDALMIDVVDQKLYIGHKKGFALAPAATITVTEPAIKSVSIDGAGDLRADTLREPDFSVSIRGVGTARIGDAELGHGKFAVGGSGAITIDQIEASDLTLAISGTGKAVAAGTAETLTVSLSGAGRVDTSALEATSAVLSLSGSGSIHARASGDATINTSGSGTVRVEGQPRCTVTPNARNVTCG